MVSGAARRDRRLLGEMSMQHKITELRGWVAAALLLAAGLLPPLAMAQERTFDVPATDAVTALPEFARQAGVQVIAPQAQLAHVHTPALQGRMDVAVALGRLLAGTGLEVAKIGRASCRERGERKFYSAA